MQARRRFLCCAMNLKKRISLGPCVRRPLTQCLIYPRALKQSPKHEPEIFCLNEIKWRKLQKMWDMFRMTAPAGLASETTSAGSSLFLQPRQSRRGLFADFTQGMTFDFGGLFVSSVEVKGSVTSHFANLRWSAQFWMSLSFRDWVPQIASSFWSNNNV